MPWYNSLVFGGALRPCSPRSGARCFTAAGRRRSSGPESQYLQQTQTWQNEAWATRRTRRIQTGFPGWRELSRVRLRAAELNSDTMNRRRSTSARPPISSATVSLNRHGACSSATAVHGPGCR